MKHNLNDALSGAICLVVLVGCGSDGPARYPLSGKVSLDGALVERGQIVLYPEQPQLPAEVVEIQNGEFSLRAAPGKKRVEIRASRETGKKGPYGEPVSEEYIPAKYNRESKLECEVQPTSTNTVKFDLSSK